MTTAFDIPAALRSLIAAGTVSASTLKAVTGIDRLVIDRLAGNVDDAAQSTASEPRLTGEEMQRLSTLAVHLTLGMETDDDDRVRGLIDHLTQVWGLSPTQVAALTRLPVDDVLGFHADPASLSAEERYRLAVRVSALALVLSNAGPATPRD